MSDYRDPQGRPAFQRFPQMGGAQPVPAGAQEEDSNWRIIKRLVGETLKTMQSRSQPEATEGGDYARGVEMGLFPEKEFDYRFSPDLPAGFTISDKSGSGPFVPFPVDDWARKDQERYAREEMANSPFARIGLGAGEKNLATANLMSQAAGLEPSTDIGDVGSMMEALGPVIEAQKKAAAQKGALDLAKAIGPNVVDAENERYNKRLDAYGAEKPLYDEAAGALKDKTRAMAADAFADLTPEAKEYLTSKGIVPRRETPIHDVLQYIPGVAGIPSMFKAKGKQLPEGFEETLGPGPTEPEPPNYGRLLGLAGPQAPPPEAADIPPEMLQTAQKILSPAQLKSFMLPYEPKYGLPWTPKMRQSMLDEARRQMTERMAKRSEKRNALSAQQQTDAAKRNMVRSKVSQFPGAGFGGL